MRSLVRPLPDGAIDDRPQFPGRRPRRKMPAKTQGDFEQLVYV